MQSVREGNLFTPLSQLSKVKIMSKTIVLIFTALKSGRLSETAILDIAIILNEVLDRSDSKGRFNQLIKEIEQINKPIRQQVDDAIKELDV